MDRSICYYMQCSLLWKWSRFWASLGSLRTDYLAVLRGWLWIISGSQQSNLITPSTVCGQIWVSFLNSENDIILKLTNMHYLKDVLYLLSHLSTLNTYYIYPNLSKFAHPLGFDHIWVSPISNHPSLPIKDF